MKSENDFKTSQEYENYLLTYFSMEFTKGILFQNMMFAETDEIDKKNSPVRVSELAFLYSNNLVNLLKTKKIICQTDQKP